MEFDFIICGAGSAGCTLANRLTAGGRYSVAIVEAGGTDRSPWIRTPVGYFKTMGNPNFDWCYRTQSDPGLANRSIPWPRGKVLGGSSSINGLLYVRGQKQDFENWKSLGNIGWGWDDVLPYFIKSENWEDPNKLKDHIHRGFSGDLPVSGVRSNSQIVSAWLESAVEAGYNWNQDYNGLTQEGVGYFQQTAINGRRCSTSWSFLRPIQTQKNLEIIKNTIVKKIIFRDLRASGVIIEKNGKEQILRAKKEIILSLGTIGSPQLLMVSGIGPAVCLKNKDIKIIKNLPGTGKNLQDHLQARPVFKCNTSTLNTNVRNFSKLILAGMQYLFFDKGPATLAASLGVGFLKTDDSLTRPDIQFHIQPFSMDRPSLDSMHRFDAFTTSVLQLRPESTGEIVLNSPKIYDQPKIFPNYLSVEKDCEVLVKGVQLARRLTKIQPLKGFITEEYAPGKNIDSSDDSSILDWIRNTAVTIYHPVGTCKMGIDENSVVDQRLRVYGVLGLRVVDASIMPNITSGNTNAPTIMIAEKGSEMILEDTMLRP